MAIRVPDIGTFCLEDVVLAVEDHAGSTDGSLQDCFDKSESFYFDGDYDNASYAPANSLKRFRNYGPPYCFVKTHTFQESSPSLGGGLNGNGIQGVWFTETGNYMFIIYYDYQIKRFSLSTAWDVTTATLSQTAYLNTSDNYSGLYFKSDGLVFYTLNVTAKRVEKWTVSSPFYLSGLSHVDSWDFSMYDDGMYGLFFSPSGDKMYLVGNEYSTTRIYQFNLTSAWDLSLSVSFYVSKNVSGIFPIVDVFLSGDGSRIYTLAQDPNYIRQLNLTTAYDLNSLVWDCYGVFDSYYDEFASAFFIKERVDDGELDVFVLGNENRKAYYWITKEEAV